MEKRKNEMIAAVMDLSSGSARDFATGLFGYMRTHSHWQFRLLPDETDITPQSVDALVKNGVRGVIMLKPLSQAAEALITSAPFKLVAMTSGGRTLTLRKRDITYVMIDDESLGRFAAEKFLALGRFRTFAFAASGRYSWSLLREKGFKNALRGKGFRVNVFRMTKTGNRADELQCLDVWVSNLAKPAAVFAATDARALQIAEICFRGGISIPNEVAVAGVDNDECLCSASTLRLSSFMPDHELLGATVGEELAKLLAAKRPLPGRKVKISGRRFIERESTRPVTTGYNLAIDAADYIAKKAHLGIRPNDVAAHLGVSRRLADLRFRQINGKSILEAITEAKLARVKKELSETDVPVAEIAAACGFDSASYLTNLFKRRFDVTPGEWRKAHA